MAQPKIRVAVLYGGRSAEHEVSLRTAANIIEYLDPNLFDVIPLGIDKEGQWFLGHEVFSKSLAHKTIPKFLENTPTWFTPEWVSKPVDNQLATTNASLTGVQFDVVFPAVHGTFCEDGCLQGLLELSGLPYVGCGVLASAVGMDKDVSKRLAKESGIRVVPSTTIRNWQWAQQQNELVVLLENNFSYPMFIKPVNTGSSIGINKAKTKQQLIAAINEALKFDTKVIIEKGLDIQELEVAVLESLNPNECPIVSVVGEIRPTHEFYSYEAKYVDEHGAELLIPAELHPTVTQEAQQMAQDLFRVLDCEGMARVDLFYDKNSKELYFNEINTIPGFTQISMYPKLMNASGMSYPDLLTHLIKLSMQRHTIRSQLIRSYSG